ncbi:hypothetical protein EUGRSUZ_L02157 [Eucalyptus grandis]|uniref:DUF4220 domain-containing protein n=1 Tax=Eucalyptus grandis TaxID=71139 RepID=A0A058ZTL8_EUCGR|nr:hypothetical protein EUGRSUZ_L02157 [Eucalyptus grandis]
MSGKFKKQVSRSKLLTCTLVWNCEGNLLRSEGGSHNMPEDTFTKKKNMLKDTCLSFALFKILRLRYAGYSLPPKAHEDAWKLIRDGLLLQEDGYERAFRVVEVELMFLYDFFYTKYGILFESSWLLNKLAELIYVVVGIWATTSLLKHYKRPNSNCRLTNLPNGLSVDVLMTSMMIISFFIVEFMQFFFMFFSEWTKVIWICEYVKNKSWQNKAWIEWIIRVICEVQLLKPWERKLRQYIFLESYFYKPTFFLNNMIMAAYIDQTRYGQKQSSPIKLHKEVKKAVLNALKSIKDTKLKNGRDSLIENDVEQLLWACKLETQTQVILVWHIATSFCEHQKPERLGSPEWTNFLVATNLSKYLAYLVAFAPRLLPDHPYVAEYVFDQAIIEARKFFNGCKTMEKLVTKIEGDSRLAEEKTVIGRGAKLRKQLIDNTYEKSIWKILADFWVELVLYVAPSDDAQAHVEHLTRGGEFVTHLWVLLSHADIKRDHSIG